MCNEIRPTRDQPAKISPFPVEFIKYFKRNVIAVYVLHVWRKIFKEKLFCFRFLIHIFLKDYISIAREWIVRSERLIFVDQFQLSLRKIETLPDSSFSFRFFFNSVYSYVDHLLFFIALLSRTKNRTHFKEWFWWLKTHKYFRFCSIVYVLLRSIKRNQFYVNLTKGNS